MPIPSVRRSRQGALPRTVDVVVAGGGAVGAAVAYQLADAGASVLLAEAFTLPDGAEPTHFATTSQRAAPPVPIAGHAVGAQVPAAGRAIEALIRRSAELYADLPARAGIGHGASTRASLHLLPDDDLVAAYTDAVARHAARGLDSMMIRAQDAAVLNPYVAAWQYAGAALIAPERWHAPGTAAADLLAAAADRGAVLREHCMVKGIERSGGAVAAAWTEHGKVHTGAVVLCAGVHSAQLAASDLPSGPSLAPGPPASADPGDLRLPLVARRRALGFTLPLVPRPGQVPATIDVGSTFWFANAEPDRVMLGVERPDRPLEPGHEPRLVPVLRRAAAQCAPALGEAPLAPGWMGTRTETPDGLPLLGAHSSGLLYATGFNGAAARVAPAVGEVVRDLLEQQEPDIDVTPLGMERFW
ncbi:NAD(P)/FAD-dependent oxidoreductase [Myceligenerans pegani]|uniref:FAD-binding oxidoreductase n=1 Tax=Myceligenerans pegani TaxID=2776917 RepID=A0ABR9MS77_9MICO|nr:FAD-binding oxidoreductase [Myceligenerans sp. TRM 65318]MBE1874229.1 FAD-binding oxidoreductase [Myceligenerans sp. TRM 65318]MBE3016500.1 FAD-binding oxidoreductase [Myceligenerans sp. TRM 65318]